MGRHFTRQEESLIAAFRGLPVEETPTRDRRTKSMASLLEACVERYQIGKSTPQEQIMEHWYAIVGESFARRSRPEKIDPSGTLHIQVANPTVRREMIFMEDRILTAIASLPDCHHVTRIYLKAGP